MPQPLLSREFERRPEEFCGKSVSAVGSVKLLLFCDENEIEI